MLPLLVLIPAAAAIGAAATWAMLAGESSAMESPLVIGARTAGLTGGVAIVMVTLIVLSVLRAPTPAPQVERG